MQLQTNSDAVGVFKRYGRTRTRKRQWRDRWIVMSEGNTRAIKQLMCGPKLLKSAMPRVIPDVDKLKEQGAVVGPYSSRLKWQGPTLQPPNRRVEQRRWHRQDHWCVCGEDCYCHVRPCVDRRVLKDRRVRSSNARPKRESKSKLKPVPTYALDWWSNRKMPRIKGAKELRDKDASPFAKKK